LRRFGDASGQVTVRRRGQLPFTANVARVAAENFLYSVVLGDGTRDASAEKTLAQFDAAGNEGFKELCDGKLPSLGSADREALSLFLVLQMTRTPEFADQFMFASNTIAVLGGIENVTLASMRPYLRDVHLRFEPADSEVQGAVDLVHGLNAMGLPTKDEQLQMMFDAALELAPRIGAWTWSIERCRKPILGTCDRLPAIWHPDRPSEAYQGSGLNDADELWCPVDMKTLLVLRKSGFEQVIEVEPKRFRFVNSHLARHCYQAVFHRPSTVDRSAEFAMSSYRPSLRFWTGPAVDENGQELIDAAGNPRMIIHQWVPIRDDAVPLPAD
jgi:hypothetical protein